MLVAGTTSGGMQARVPSARVYGSVTRERTVLEQLGQAGRRLRAHSHARARELTRMVLR